MNALPLLLAQAPDDDEDMLIAQPADTLIEWLMQWDLIPERFAFIAEQLLSPGLTILLILLLAGTLSRLSKRAITRGVERMKTPEAERSRFRTKLTGDDDRLADLRREQRAEALGAVARSTSSIVIWTLAVVMALAQVQVQVGPLIAGAGIAGVALGFGAQDLVKDFLSGIFMLIEDQYGVGDIIDAGEASGVVEGISLRSTRIRDVQGTLWHIPNGEIRRVGNMSQEFSRALLDIGVAYGADIDAAADIIQRVAVDMSHEEQYAEQFVDEPELLGVEALGSDSVDIRLLIKTQPAKQWAISRELRRRIKNAFDAADVEIPFPQRTVWLRTEGPVAVGGADAPPFETTVPDEPTRQRAVEASRRGDTGAPDEMSELLPEDPVMASEDGDEV